MSLSTEWDGVALENKIQKCTLPLGGSTKQAVRDRVSDIKKDNWVSVMLSNSCVLYTT